MPDPGDPEKLAQAGGNQPGGNQPAGGTGGAGATGEAEEDPAGQGIRLNLNTITRDASVLLRLADGARGVLWASQIAIDEENGLNLRVYGEKGSLEWHQEEPNTLLLKWPDKPREVVRAGANYTRLSPEAVGASRLPAGHPEGYLEGFANLYRSFAAALLEGIDPATATLDCPTVKDGVRGMAFIDATVASSNDNAKWTRIRA